MQEGNQAEIPLNPGIVFDMVQAVPEDRSSEGGY